MISSIDLSLVTNPFAEIPHLPVAENAALDLLERTAIDKIIRMENNQVFPKNGMGFEILSVYPEALSQVDNAVTPYARKLHHLVANRDEERFNAILRHLRDQTKLRCLLCRCTIPNDDAASTVIHIKGMAHTRQMIERGLAYPIESLAFWMYALRIAQKDAPWYPVSLEPEQEREVTIRKFDFSMMPNPLHEMKQLKMIAELKSQTSTDRIIRLEDNAVHPAFDIDPLDVLCRFSAPNKEAEKSVDSLSSKMHQLIARSDKTRFDELFHHILVEKTMHCAVCNCDIESTASELVGHISGGPHLRKMRQGTLIFPVEALAFWMLALRIAEKKAPWVKEEKRKEKLPKPFKPQEPKARDIPVETSVDPQSPLAIFCFYTFVPNPCKHWGLVTSFMYKQLRNCTDMIKLKEEEGVLEGIAYDKKWIKCALCNSPEKLFLEDTTALITHVISTQHFNAVNASEGKVDMEAIFFWFDVLSRASKNKKEALAKPRSALNCELVAGMVEPTSPLALLSRCLDVVDPCPDIEDAMTKLRTKSRKCENDKFDEAMSKYFKKSLLCGICIEYKRIRSGSDFIAHVTSDDHVRNLKGDVSRTALRFWLDALCDAGAQIMPKESDEVIRLFGEKEELFD